LRFASLQSDFAEKVLRVMASTQGSRHVHVVENYDQPASECCNGLMRFCARARAGGFWARLHRRSNRAARASRSVYRFVATNRYRVFGKYDTCMLPDPNQRSRFLDV
jgi:predicted DCC family thiol-disulfide oxidoreductase YuxK